jgi:hypothetical protein
MKLSKEKQSVITDAQANGFTVKYSDGCVKVYRQTRHKKPRLICGIIIYADATAYRLDVPHDRALTIRSAQGMREALSLLTKKPRGKNQMPKITMNEQGETFIAPTPAEIKAAAPASDTAQVNAGDIVFIDNTGIKYRVEGIARSARTAPNELEYLALRDLVTKGQRTWSTGGTFEMRIVSSALAEMAKAAAPAQLSPEENAVLAILATGPAPAQEQPAEDDDAEQTACRKCGEPANNGEGWDGLCGTCADKQENEEEETRPAEPITTDIPPDPDEMNAERAAAAEAALMHFVRNFGEGDDDGLTADLKEQNLSDLLGDLAHYCDRNELSLSGCFERAAMHYAAETDNQGTQFDDEDPQTRRPVRTVVITLEGGMVRDVISTQPAQYAVIDYDTDGAEQTDLLAIPQDATGKATAEATGHFNAATVNTLRALQLYRAVEAGKAGS